MLKFGHMQRPTFLATVKWPNCIGWCAVRGKYVCIHVCR